jgi:hypothetical protein
MDVEKGIDSEVHNLETSSSAGVSSGDKIDTQEDSKPGVHKPKVTSVLCQCAKEKGSTSTIDYTHMGHGRSLESIQRKLSLQTKTKLEKLKIVVINKVLNERMEGCIDCPLTPDETDVCRRGEEAVLVLVQNNFGHTCDYAFTVASVIVWDGIAKDLADEAYTSTKNSLPQSEEYLQRGCARNRSKTCSCQGQDTNLEKAGVSFSFGCSYSTYNQGCKFKYSQNPRKFKLHRKMFDQEEEMATLVNKLSDQVRPDLKIYAPGAFDNQTRLQVNSMIRWTLSR